MSEPFVGMIAQVGFNFAPRGWQFCNGQLVSIQQNTAVFALVGTTYGGNGTTTFGLPNLQGRVAVGFGNGAGLSPYVLGQVGGTENTSLLVSNLPQHTHSLNVSTTKASSQIPIANGTLGHSKDGATNPTSVPEIYCPAGTAVDITQAPTSIGLTGSGIPFPTLQPYLAINYIFSMQGIFPTRN